MKVKFHSPEMSFLEGILARGDARLSDVIETAYAKGARFDGWDDKLRLQLWLEAMNENCLDPASYLRSRDPEEPLPWDPVDVGVSKEFLKTEWQKAVAGVGAMDCRFGECADCGVCDFDQVYPRLAEPSSQDIPSGPGPEDLIEQLHPIRFRLQYTKTGFMSLLGHHDIERSFHRAFRRAGLRLDHSRGFHPHPRMRFSSPTGMGIESLCEFVDFDLLEPVMREATLLEILRRTLPRDIHPVSISQTPLNEPAFSAKIHYVTYQINVGDLVSPENIDTRVRDFQESATFVMSNLRKGKQRHRDLKTWIASLKNRVNTIEMIVKASPAGSVNPREAARAILSLTSNEAQSLKISKTSVCLEPSRGGQQFS